MNYIVSVTACSSQPWDTQPSLLHIELVHTSSSILTSSLYPNIYPVVLQLIGFDISFTVIVSSLRSMQEK